MEQPVSWHRESGRPNKQRIIEIVLTCAIAIVFLVSALLYFNIIPLKSLKQNKLTNVPTVTPKPFQYDTAKAKTLLTQYIKDAIKPELLPTSMKTEQAKNVHQYTENPNFFVFPFAIQEASVSALFRYDKNANISNSFSISIDLKNIPSIAGATALANTLLSTYFANPYVIFTCKQDSTSIYCEDFKITDDGKRGYGITIFGTPPKSVNTVFTCFIPKESEAYISAKTCVAF